MFTIEEFTRQLATELHALPGIAGITPREQEVEVRLREATDDSLIISARNFYKSYRRNGDLVGALGAAVSNLRELVETRAQRKTMDDWPSARPRIFPRLQPLANLRKRVEHKGVEIKRLWDRWLGDVAISYVIDFPSNVQYIQEHTLRAWEQDAATIRALAMQNLRELALRDTPVQALPPLPFGGRAYAIRTSDGYAATRLLLPDLVERWTRRRVDPAELRIALASHDILLFAAAGPGGRNVLPLRMLARELARQFAPYQLSQHLFTLRDGAVVEA